MVSLICFGQSNRSNPDDLRCLNSLKVTHKGDNYLIKELGQKHNLFLSYLTSYQFSNDFAKNCTFFKEYNSVATSYATSSEISLHPYFDFSDNCSENSIVYELVQNSNDILAIKGYASNNSLQELGAISLDEKLFVQSLIKSLEDKSLLNYCSLISEWESLQKGIYDGLYSGSILSVYIYSTYYWQEYDLPRGVVLENGDDPQRFGPWGDLIGGVVGFADYMYDNWDDHYNDDFGMNALSHAGGRALNGSSFGLYDAVRN